MISAIYRDEDRDFSYRVQMPYPAREVLASLEVVGKYLRPLCLGRVQDRYVILLGRGNAGLAEG
jgi:hypothetical protein